MDIKLDENYCKIEDYIPYKPSNKEAFNAGHGLGRRKMAEQFNENRSTNLTATLSYLK